MKFKRSLLSLLLICAILFTVAGCAYSVEHITDISGYGDMQSGGDKIDVWFENGTLFGFNFTIDDKTEIDEIVDLVLSTRMVYLGRNVPVAPGDNTGFTVYQGENTYRIQLSGVRDGDKSYGFATDDLRNKINAVAEARGAFDR